MKYYNFKRYKFSTIQKNVDIIRDKFLKIIKFTRIRTYDFRKIYSFIDFRRFNFGRFIRKISFKEYRNLPLYFICFSIFVGTLYVIAPYFYTYDKSIMQKFICGKMDMECLIGGKIKYSFYPTPRIKIRDLTINNSFQKDNTFLNAKDVAIKLSLKNLVNLKKQNYKSLHLKNFELNFNLKKLKNYRDIFSKNINFLPIFFTGGKAIFFDGENYVSTINDVNLDLELSKDHIEGILKGDYLNDKLYVNLSSKKIEDKKSTDIILKMSNLNLLTKVNFFKSTKNEESEVNGNILIKKNKNVITAIFDYNDKELNIIKSNLKNAFTDGKLKGKITLLPFFKFDLDIDLNSINFTRLFSYFLNLDEKGRKDIFKINKKINGKLNLSANKVNSRYNLIKSFESRIKLNNGNIFIEQFLLNLGKLGAADILGTINNDKKFTNFRYQSNVYVDNEKKFLSKFGIYEVSSISPSYFISGNFDLNNLKNFFYEISENKKYSAEDINYIEREFNNVMLEEGYESLFNFPQFKEFIKIISDNES